METRDVDELHRKIIDSTPRSPYLLMLPEESEKPLAKIVGRHPND